MRMKMHVEKTGHERKRAAASATFWLALRILIAAVVKKTGKRNLGSSVAAEGPLANPYLEQKSEGPSVPVPPDEVHWNHAAASFPAGSSPWEFPVIPKAVSKFSTDFDGYKNPLSASSFGASSTLTGL